MSRSENVELPPHCNQVRCISCTLPRREPHLRRTGQPCPRVLGQPACPCPTLHRASVCAPPSSTLTKEACTAPSLAAVRIGELLMTCSAHARASMMVANAHGRQLRPMLPCSSCSATWCSRRRWCAVVGARSARPTLHPSHFRTVLPTCDLAAGLRADMWGEKYKNRFRVI